VAIGVRDRVGGPDPHVAPGSSSRPWIERLSGHYGLRILGDGDMSVDPLQSGRRTDR
jgi:hypothetical protein